MLSSHAVKPAIPPNPMEADMNISQLGSSGIELAAIIDIRLQCTISTLKREQGTLGENL